MVTCLGFLTTVVSIECINVLIPVMGGRYAYVFLVLGPVTGLIMMVQARIHRKRSDGSPA